jgi:hypothetical protein
MSIVVRIMRMQWHRERHFPTYKQRGIGRVESVLGQLGAPEVHGVGLDQVEVVLDEIQKGKGRLSDQQLQEISAITEDQRTSFIM